MNDNMESLHKISLRGCVFLLEEIKHHDPEIEKTITLYERVIADDTPTDEQWAENIESQAQALALAQGLGQSNALVNYLLPLLGDRVPLIKNIYDRILTDIDGPFTFDMAEWHPCGTTYCMGGFSVLYAGKEGSDLADHFGYALASAMIFMKSTGSVPDLYSSNDKAIAYMKAQTQ